MDKKNFFLSVFMLLVGNFLCEAQVTLPAQVWSEIEVNLTAAEVWAVYSSPDLPRLIVELMPHRYQKIDVLEGDGTQGTILNITLQPSNLGPLTWSEEFVTIDHRKRTKVVRQIQGGFLGIGFVSYENIYKISRKTRTSCVIRATASFVVNQGSEYGASFINASWRMAYALIDHIRAKKASNHVSLDSKRS
ncbi:hypothetical protein ACHQM5_011755 [Ranunculus cassubicifolius]